MAREKKSEKTSKKTDQRSGRHSQGRRDRFVDSFSWGFVDGDEKEFGSDDVQDADSVNRKRKSDKNSKNKSKESPSGQSKENGNWTADKKNSGKGKQSSKKIVPNFPLFDGDEDDDLNLPSYGRTPVPTDDELPQPIPSNKATRREPNKKTAPKEKNAERHSVKKDFAEKKDVVNPLKSSAKKPFDWKRPEFEQQSNKPEDSSQELRSNRPQKEQMVWDPEKREYVPLVVPKPIAKPEKKTRKKSSDFALKKDRNDSWSDPFVEDDADKKSNSHKPDFSNKSTSRKDRLSEKTKRKPETVQKKESIPAADRNPVSEVNKRSEKGRKENKKSEITIPSSDQKDKVVDKTVKVEHRLDTPSENRETDGKSRKKRVRDRNRQKQLQQRADVSRMVESNVPDPADIESEAKGFAKLGVSETMLESLKMIRFLEPTPIQAGVFQQVKAGQDVMGQAQTGTGKTAAFSIPIIEGIEECPPGNDPVAMILVPTRELAVQVRDEAAKLSYGRDIRISACYGGKPIAKQIAKLKDGVDILVGTPGRVLDLMNRRALSLDALRWVVLDEADRMLDIGFRPDIEKILRRTPKERQTLLFSATLAPPVVKLAEKYMKSPEVLDFSNKGIAVETIEQFYITVDQERKFDALVYLLNEQEPNQAIIFTRTKRGADRLARLLSKRFESLSAIHGDLSQSERDRVMGNFRNGKLRYLVATDVVGRGIDVSGISHIINYDIPAFCDDYVHRVGRTGRMGREGVAYTFVTVEEGAELTRIEMRIDKLLKRAELKGFETFAKPVDNSEGTDGSDDDPSPPSKPVFGQSARKIRRAL